MNLTTGERGGAAAGAALRWRVPLLYQCTFEGCRTVVLLKPIDILPLFEWSLSFFQKSIGELLCFFFCFFRRRSSNLTLRCTVSPPHPFLSFPPPFPSPPAIQSSTLLFILLLFCLPSPPSSQSRRYSAFEPGQGLHVQAGSVGFWR